MRKAMVLWFTGLSGSGKTTIANRASERLRRLNKKVKIYDGDVVREGINRHLTFSPEHIDENNRLIAAFCLENSPLYDYIFVPVISPFSASRESARKMIGDSFSLVYIKASLEEVIKRDPKGLYKKALAGEIKNFVGLAADVPYQTPDDADLTLDTEKNDIGTLVDELMGFIVSKTNDFNGRAEMAI